MELQPQQQQEKDTKTLLENKGEEASGVVEVVPAKSKDSCADKPEKDDGGSAIDSAGPSSIGDPGPSSCSETTHDTSGKEEESFPSVFISHASINISGSNPDISESEKLRKATARAEIGEREGSASKGNIDSFTIPQRVVVHRVCSDSRIGEGEGFHSSKLAFYTADGSFSSSLKALGLSVNNGGSRSGSMKNKNRQKQGSSSSEQLSSKEKVNNNASAPTTSEVVKKRSQTSNKGCDPRGNGVELSGAGESGSGTSSNVCGGGVNKYIEILPPIEQSISESKTEHPSTSEGEETLAEDVVDDEEELLDEYDEPSKSLDCQLDFDAAVTELLLRPEKKARYKDSATWTQEDDMPSPLSDLSPVASPRRKKESNRNFHRELDRETGHSHNSLLEQYHHYLLEQQQHKQPQAHRHSRGGSGSKSGGSGSQHHHHSHHSQQHHSHQNPKSSIVGIHQGNLKTQSHSHHPHQSQTQIPLQAECFTVSSQLLSREAKLYENVPATQGELETLEILLASGGSGDSNYPPSGGSGSGGAASNTTASTSNTSGTSGQSHKTSSHGNNLNNNHNSNNSHHRSHHHHQQQQPHHHHHHLLHQGYVHGQHSHSATNLNTNTGNSAEQLFSVSDFLGSGGGLSVGNNNGGPPSRTSWADSGRESLSFDGENNNSTGSTRNLLLIPPPPPPPINYLASASTAGHSGFNSSSMMHPSHHSQHHSSSKHSSHHSHHHHSQAQASESPSHHQTHNTKRSRRERLVRQKHAIDESIFPSHGGSDKIDGGGEGTVNSSLMGVPSPRRGLLPGSMQASNFIAAAASPISLQRHPPASQIMLQENKKNGPLIPCESPYGIMAGGPGTVGTVDWPYPETFGENLRRNTNKSHLTGNILRSRSPQRGRGIGSKGNNSSFDYGELPSHQMFPKRHLLTSRQFSGHRGYSPGASGTMQNNGNNGLCPPTGFQPMQHRSFPAGVFSGATPRSCSMGDLTSSAASLNGPNGQGHHHSNHHSGKSPERLAISSNTAPVNGMQSSTVPLVTSLPLPPATSVTYEFSLAPVSGTLAPGWHLTAVQRGLATAVPLAAAVARRRLPRPRTARPRFGFTDKNEARRAKWTIVITALALLAMSMLLVGVTLRLAPLIDDLDPVDPQEILNILIQRHMEQENLKKMRHAGGLAKHYQQNPDAIHRLADGGDSRSEVEMLQQNFNTNPPRVKPQTPTGSSARSTQLHYDTKCKASRSDQSLSDRICQVVWRRKESTPSVTPQGSKRFRNSVRRGTAPSVPFMPFSLQKPDVFGRSQSFKGSSSSGSFKNRAASHRDPLSRRASGSAVATAEAYVALSSLKAKNNKLSQGCTAVGLDYGHNNLGQNEHSSLNSSIGSGQNLSSNLTAVLPLEKKLGGGLATRTRDGEVDMRRQISTTLSIPSREDSVRSYASSKSYVIFSAAPTSEIAGGQMKPSMKKLARYGSNPDVFSSHRTRRRDEERDALYLPTRAEIASSKSLASFEHGRSRSNSNIGSRVSGGMAHSTCLSDKKKQILSEKQKRNEKVAWAVHLGFSSLLILAITCIVVSLRLASTVPPVNQTELVRKENESLLQSIQPQLNSQNLTTPQPTTHTHEAQDNSIANPDNSMDKSIESLQSGQSLTRSKVTSSFDESHSETGDEQKSNKTTNANLDASEGGENSSFNRSNNHVINSDTDNPSLKSNSIRPKRSRPRSKLDDVEQTSSRSSSIIIRVLNEKVGANDLNDTSGLAKTRHLESSIIRFLKNSNGQEGRNLESASRNL